MTGSDFTTAWKRLDVAVIAAADGAGRAVIERTGGIGEQAEAIRRAAVLSRDLRFAAEPGWMLRWLPDGRGAIFCGGTQHPKLVDHFGRTGIFHGVALVAPRGDVGTLLGTADLHALAWAAVRFHLHGERVDLPKVGSPLTVRRLPARDRALPLASSSWRHVHDALAQHGVRAFTAPTRNEAGLALSYGQPKITPGRNVAARRVPDAASVTERVLAAWPS